MASVALEPGDVIVVYSDGVVETMNEAREAFGDERLGQLLTAHAADDTADALAARIEHAAISHTSDAPQADDVTMLVIRRI